MKIERSGPGLEKLEATLRELSSKGVEVGIREGNKYPDGTDIAYVAATQEYGFPAGGIPERSFFRTTVADKKTEWADNVGRGAAAVLAGRLSVNQMLGQVGMAAAGDIRKKISSIMSPALADSTLDARRRRAGGADPSTKPLVDTGQMLRAVDSAVVDV